MRKHLLIGAIAVGLLAPLAAQAQVNGVSVSSGLIDINILWTEY